MLLLWDVVDMLSSLWFQFCTFLPQFAAMIKHSEIALCSRCVFDTNEQTVRQTSISKFRATIKIASWYLELSEFTSCISSLPCCTYYSKQGFHANLGWIRFETILFCLFHTRSTYTILTMILMHASNVIEWRHSKRSLWQAYGRRCKNEKSILICFVLVILDVHFKWHWLAIMEIICLCFHNHVTFPKRFCCSFVRFVFRKTGYDSLGSTALQKVNRTMTPVSQHVILSSRASILRFFGIIVVNSGLTF